MKLMLGLLLAAGIIAAQPPPAPSSTAGWANVKRLATGDEIRVSLFGSNGSGGKSFNGKLQSVTDESMVIATASSQETLTRVQIAKVATKRDSHRGRNALIGLGVGAGAGLGIGAGADHSCAAGGCFIGPNFGKEVFIPLGALVGTIIGVAWPTGGWHDIYRVK
jgi:hypothetical protein